MPAVHRYTQGVVDKGRCRRSRASPPCSWRMKAVHPRCSRRKPIDIPRPVIMGMVVGVVGMVVVYITASRIQILFHAFKQFFRDFPPGIALFKDVERGFSR